MERKKELSVHPLILSKNGMKSDCCAYDKDKFPWHCKDCHATGYGTIEEVIAHKRECKPNLELTPEQVAAIKWPSEEEVAKQIEHIGRECGDTLAGDWSVLCSAAARDMYIWLREYALKDLMPEEE